MNDGLTVSSNVRTHSSLAFLTMTGGFSLILYFLVIDLILLMPRLTSRTEPSPSMALYRSVLFSLFYRIRLRRNEKTTIFFFFLSRFFSSMGILFSLSLSLFLPFFICLHFRRYFPASLAFRSVRKKSKQAKL